MKSMQEGSYFNYKIAGLSTLVGNIVSMDEWAESFKIPNRKKKGEFLTGSDIQNIIGPVTSKSWDPDLFRNFNQIVNVARDALDAAGLETVIKIV